MIHIKYKIKESPIHGIGLFADQNIKAGELIYTPNPLLDVNITKAQFDSLSLSEQDEVKYYGYFNKKTGLYHVAFEAIRFLNHSKVGLANVTQDENMVMIAFRDIAEGEELTQNYLEQYSADDEHFLRVK